MSRGHRRAGGSRAKKARGASVVGQRHTVEVGPIAHGGHCVARVPVTNAAGEPESRVVFVRHTLPGEQVVVELTEGTEGDRFWRGDAVEVVAPAVGRVAAPCAVSGPGGCGGCDFQHVDVGFQRELKASVVREQLTRLAKLDAEDPLLTGFTVDAVPGDEDGLRWRTRTTYVDLPGGRRGLRKHRSHEVVEVEDCLIDRHTDVDSDSDHVVESVSAAGETIDFLRAADGFWQVHPGAPTALVEAVLEALDPQPGERALDLYAGVGLFAAFLAGRVGDSGSVVAIEGDRDAVNHAKGNLGRWRQARAQAGSVDKVLRDDYDAPFDLVVLDPPREGAKRKVVEQIVDRAPRAVAYVACDPAALARDVAIFAEHGYALTSLRGFDLFPMTHHVECVALLTQSGSDLR